MCGGVGATWWLFAHTRVEHVNNITSTSGPAVRMNTQFYHNIAITSVHSDPTKQMNTHLEENIITNTVYDNPTEKTTKQLEDKSRCQYISSKILNYIFRPFLHGWKKQCPQ